MGAPAARHQDEPIGASCFGVLAPGRLGDMGTRSSWTAEDLVPHPFFPQFRIFSFGGGAWET